MTDSKWRWVALSCLLHNVVSYYGALCCAALSCVVGNICRLVAPGESLRSLGRRWDLPLPAVFLVA